MQRLKLMKRHVPLCAFVPLLLERLIQINQAGAGFHALGPGINPSFGACAIESSLLGPVATTVRACRANYPSEMIQTRFQRP
jgi:hypothetical protein